MKSDIEIQKAVDAELRWGMTIDADDFDVKVKDQVVILSGVVHTYAHKMLAERVAVRAAEGCMISNIIEVRNENENKRSISGSRKHVSKEYGQELHDEIGLMHFKKSEKTAHGKMIEKSFNEKYNEHRSQKVAYKKR